MIPELEGHQKEHVLVLHKILSTEKTALDTSPPGCGKTYTTVYLAMKLSLKLFVVAPEIVHTSWEVVSSLFGVTVSECITYERLRGVRGRNLSHEFLERDDERDEYKPSNELINLISEGVLFVFDEFHYTKNLDTSQSKSCRTIVREVKKSNSNSRIILLSATHISKDISLMSVFGMLGLYRASGLYELQGSSRVSRNMRNVIKKQNPGQKHKKKKGKFVLTGYHELIREIERMGDSETLLSSLEIPTSGKDVVTNCSKIFQTFLKFKLSSEMPKPKHYEELYGVSHEFYDAPEEIVSEIKKNIGRLITSITGSQEENTERLNFGQIQRSIQNLQETKAPIVIQEAKKILDSDPKCKVVIFGDFCQPLISIEEGLREYGTILFIGKSARSRKAKDDLVRTFQEDSGRKRVLVSNTRMGGVGVSLDDKIGNRKRYMLLMPNYSFDNLCQALGRCCRTTSKSRSEAVFVYCKGCEEEFRILDSLRNKTSILTKMSLSDKGYMLGLNTSI